MRPALKGSVRQSGYTFGYVQFNTLLLNQLNSFLDNWQDFNLRLKIAGRANQFYCFIYSLSICCVRRISQYLMTSATPNVEKPMFNCDFWVRKLREKERERMRRDALPRKRLYTCECVHDLNLLTNAQLRGFYFEWK